jgi:hypothetical protein
LGSHSRCDHAPPGANQADTSHVHLTPVAKPDDGAQLAAVHRQAGHITTTRGDLVATLPLVHPEYLAVATTVLSRSTAAVHPLARRLVATRWAWSLLRIVVPLYVAITEPGPPLVIETWAL